MAKKISKAPHSVAGADGPLAVEESVGITSEERRRRVEVAAYLRAAAREFLGGDPVQDWIEAEAEVNEHLKRE
jgi:hypothetical protein